MVNASTNPAAAGSKGQRPCPAIRGFISPADCGEQRGSKLDCPAECPFFPFGSAGGDELWVKTDSAWTKKAIDYVIARVGRPVFERRLKEVTLPMGSRQRDLHGALYTAVQLFLFVDRDAAGRTLADRWEAEAWTGLNNDERVMLRCRRTAQLTVVEVQSAVPDLGLRCLDLLEAAAEPFLLLDRGAAQSVVRFTRILTWVVRLPHAARLAATALEVALAIWPAWRSEVERQFEEARQASPELMLKRFLAENPAGAARLIAELNARHRLDLLDAYDLNLCMAVYRLTGGSHAQVETVLRGLSDFTPHEVTVPPNEPEPVAAFTWAIPTGTTTAPSGSPPANNTLGLVRLYEDALVVDTTSRPKHALARQLVEKHFGALVAFLKETMVDRDQAVRAQQARESTLRQAEAAVYGGAGAGAASAAENAAARAERRRQIEAAHADRCRTFLDEPLPALDGLSPRVAAAKPELRPRLVELMKGYLQKVARQNLDEGMSLSLDPVLDELGLSELK
jgi:hypothetical protein